MSELTVATIMPTSPASTVILSTVIISTAPMLTILLGLTAIAGLLWRNRALRGTTLVAPWCWAIVAVAAIVAVEVLAWFVPSLDRAAGLSPTRYTAYAATFCPIVALLGAKRPQDRGWQAIVLSLWGIMLMPAFSALFFSRGEFTVELIWSWFLAILIAVGFFNSLPTKFRLAGLLVTVAQIIALGDVLPGLSAWFQSDALSGYLAGGHRSALVLAILTIAIGSVHATRFLADRRPRPGDLEQPTRMQAMNHLWHDFRDAFGTIWGLRIAERINANAARYDWGIVLRWGGFERISSDHAKPLTQEELDALPDDAFPDDALPPEVVDAIESSTRVLLRRFVSSEWIDERLGVNPTSESPEQSASPC